MSATGDNVEPLHDSSPDIVETSTPHFAESWLADFGNHLYGYAIARVSGDATIAEELVQETFLAGITGFAQFQHGSSIETWLTGILRRKIFDYYRRRYRHPEVLTDEPAFFTENGHIQNVRIWAGDPQQTLESDEFWQQFDQCMKKLKSPLAAAFVACSMDGLDTNEACNLLGISSTNLSVRLHRARLALRECLQKNWFGDN